MAGVTDKVEFEWVTDHKPSLTEIEEEQDRRGYNKWGYGEPCQVKTIKVENSLDEHGDRYKTTWYCFGSCD